jgi:hypothetical protein
MGVDDEWVVVEGECCEYTRREVLWREADGWDTRAYKVRNVYFGLLCLTAMGCWGGLDVLTPGWRKRRYSETMQAGLGFGILRNLACMAAVKTCVEFTGIKLGTSVRCLHRGSDWATFWLTLDACFLERPVNEWASVRDERKTWVELRGLGLLPSQCLAGCHLYRPWHAGGEHRLSAAALMFRN